MSVYNVKCKYVSLLCQCNMSVITQFIMSMQMSQAPTDGHNLAKTPQGGNTTHKFAELGEVGGLVATATATTVTLY